MRERYEAYGKLMIAMHTAKDTDLPEEFWRRAEWIKEEITEQKSCIVITGGYKSGKTTTANQLFGQELLPAKSYVSTKSICRVYYAKEYQVHAAALDGKEKNFLLGNAGDVRQRILDLWEEGVDAEKIDAGIPCPWMQRAKLEVLDLPDMGEQEEAFFRMLSKGQHLQHRTVIVFTVSACVPFDRVERQMLKRLIVWGGSIRFIIFITGLDKMEQEDRSRIAAFLRKRILQAMSEEAELADEEEKSRLTAFLRDMEMIADYEEGTEAIDELRERLTDTERMMGVHSTSLVFQWISQAEKWTDREKCKMLELCRSLYQELKDTQEHHKVLEAVWEYFLLSDQPSGVETLLAPVFRDVLESFPEMYAQIMVQGLEETAVDFLRAREQEIQNTWDERVEQEFQRILSKPAGLFTSMELKRVCLPDAGLCTQILNAFSDAIYKRLCENQAQADHMLEELSHEILQKVQSRLKGIPYFDKDCEEVWRIANEEWKLCTDMGLIPSAEDLKQMSEFHLLSGKISRIISAYCVEYQHMKEAILADYRAEEKKRPRPPLFLYVFYQQPRIRFIWKEDLGIDWDQGMLRCAALPAIGKTLMMRFLEQLDEWAKRMDQSYYQVLKKRSMVRTELLLSMNRRKKQCLSVQLQNAEREAAKLAKAGSVYHDLQIQEKGIKNT